MEALPTAPDEASGLLSFPTDRSWRRQLQPASARAHPGALIVDREGALVLQVPAEGAP